MLTYTSNVDLVKVYFNTISQDMLLKSLLPGAQVRLYDSEAPPEPEFPYFVHRIVLGGGSLEDVVSKGRYYISIYTAEPGSSLLNSLAKRLVNMLNNMILSSSDVGFTIVTLVEGGGRVDTGNDNVKRFDIPFDLSFSL